jgi:hypothetical protein
VQAAQPLTDRPYCYRSAGWKPAALPAELAGFFEAFFPFDFFDL